LWHRNPLRFSDREALVSDSILCRLLTMIINSQTN
jgi:hypothetical protein